ncbi:MAG TPA: M48 family metalloprotease [Mycobacteriales bacterium]|nr:M48 family metalloprotease [Mycobacteriales bacterium]
MRVDVYVPLLMALIFGQVAPWLSRRLPPRHATWLLTVGGAVLASATAVVLGLLALTLIGQLPDIAAFGHWTVSSLRQHDPVHRSVALAALIAIPVLAALLVRTAVRRGRVIVEAYRTCRRLPDHGTSLVVLPDPGITAYAVPGRPGRIVVSRELLTALPADQRRVVLAHERAHLDHHHYRHVAIVVLAAALNPLLARLPDAAVFATERWADEVAAQAAGDRVVAATALAHTRLLTAATARPARVLAAAATHVTARVQALLAAPPRNRPMLAAVGVAIISVAAIAAVGATWDAHQLFELVQQRTHRS